MANIGEVYEMTWREFQLRRMGFLRSEKREWEKTRLTAYYSLVSTGAIDTKKTSIDKFMPLDGTKRKTGVSQTAREAFLLANKKYLEEKNGRIKG